MRSVSEFDSMAPETVEDPFAFYEALREQAPVHFDERLQTYLVSRYDGVWRVIHDTERFSSAIGPAALMPPMEAIQLLLTGHPPVHTLLTADPPEHIRFRTLVSRAFAPRRVSKMIDSIRALANELVDEFSGDGHLDLIAQFGVPFPLTLLADQLGVPRRDMPSFKRWADDIAAFLGGMISNERYVECAQSILDYQRYFEARIEECRAEPREGILSDVVHARIDGVDPLSMAELLSIFQQFIVAGHETSTNMIGSTLLLLLRNPDQLALVREDPALIPLAVEESLRLESPTQALFRIATCDVELEGVAIPGGSRVGVIYGSANRDPRKFDDPDRFDLRRPNLREHLAFGHGTHYCVGAGLARAEGAVALETLLARTRNLRLAAQGNDFAHHPSFILRGLKQLHLEFDPA